MYNRSSDIFRIKSSESSEATVPEFCSCSIQPTNLTYTFCVISLIGLILRQHFLPWTPATFPSPSLPMKACRRGHWHGRIAISDIYPTRILPFVFLMFQHYFHLVNLLEKLIYLYALLVRWSYFPHISVDCNSENDMISKNSGLYLE